MRKLPSSFTDILDRDYRWPKKGDRLLRRSDDWNLGVGFTSHPISKHALLWDGYLSAADGLVQMCLSEGYGHERHTVIYPILFNYRHGLELAMKWVVLMYGGTGISGVQVGHNLWQLWKECRRIIEETGPTEKDVDDAVEQVIKDYHELDKSGVNLRYGWGKDGHEIKLPDRMIDLENLRDVMEGIANYFGGLDGWLDDQRSTVR
ncbi:hypothetical protein [Acidimangrovimonas sediminis]|uniref:hypothetical protein n=1 Tax=Acidimangrovimonas sediminis TaxID=2056283 RepID=UPI000C7FA533|nr:hypothetical protein [Acidimangrovimonas sediminis]